jgi:hypothetical protein
MKIKLVDTLPRMITIEGMNREDYRNLQMGQIVDIDPTIGNKLIKAGFALESEAEKAEELNV